MSQISEDSKRVPLKLIGAAECPVFYANVGSVINTQFDIQLVLGEVVQVDDKVVIGRVVARVVMAPEHAVLLMRTLQKRIDQFIAKSGPLRMDAIDSITTADDQTAAGELKP
jgi:hypothetical protein